jgi:(p)ppGpp synthase/HD superfamily hydrolase
METCRQYTADVCILAAALLHDILEDTMYTRDQLSGFLKEVMTAEHASGTLSLVVELTDVYTKSQFPHLNRRKRKAREMDRLEKTSGDSQTIKYADIIDNCREIVEHDPEFAGRFLSECSGLLQRLKKGNQQLHQRAVDLVNRRMHDLRNQQKVHH